MGPASPLVACREPFGLAAQQDFQSSSWLDLSCECYPYEVHTYGIIPSVVGHAQERAVLEAARYEYECSMFVLGVRALSFRAGGSRV